MAMAAPEEEDEDEDEEEEDRRRVGCPWQTQAQKMNNTLHVIETMVGHARKEGVVRRRNRRVGTRSYDKKYRRRACGAE